MGIIEDARHAMAVAEREGQSRAEATVAILGNISATLAQPEFKGDVETALVHHMGRRVVDAEAATAPYIDLAETIARQPEEKMVPTLFIYGGQFRETGTIDDGYKTAFLAVDRQREGIQFKSVRYESGGSSLSIQARTFIYSGNILSNQGVQRRIRHNLPEFVLSESDISDTENGQEDGRFAGHAFSASQKSKFENTPKIYVGWQDIEKVLCESLRNPPYSSNTKNRLTRLLKIQSFIETVTDEWELNALAPELYRLVETAHNLRRFIPLEH